MSDDGLVTDAGRQLRARLLAGEDPLPGLGWVAIGDGTWVDKLSPPVESVGATGLTHELARKKADRIAYLQEDAGLGTIYFDNKKWKEVAGPSNVLAVIATFLETEAEGFTICEEAVFGGVVTTTAQPYALAAQVTVPGVCYWVRNRVLYVKGPRDQFQVIAVFKEV